AKTRHQGRVKTAADWDAKKMAAANGNCQKDPVVCVAAVLTRPNWLKQLPSFRADTYRPPA
ncbi:MAG: hypothetical protein K9L59_15210, partial [Desulfobacterales bacterium]|nr:hypothetical protein [Desulfobacterales bacterium]